MCLCVSMYIERLGVVTRVNYRVNKRMYSWGVAISVYGDGVAYFFLLCFRCAFSKSPDAIADISDNSPAITVAQTTLASV